MIQPGMMRWKAVPSKKPLRASAANEAAALGDWAWSSSMAKVPQLVATLTT